MTDRHLEYIRQLEERNRMKKMMNAKSEQQLHQEELEKGFTTHFGEVRKAKEPLSAAPKVAARPQVVKTAKLATHDLASRLLPPGTKNAAISQRDASSDDYPSDFEEQISPTDEAPPDNAEGATPPGNAGDTAPPAEMQRQGGPAEPLVSNIQNLSKEQKLVLLQLLQDSINSDTSPQPALSSMLPVSARGSEEGLGQQRSAVPATSADNNRVGAEEHGEISSRELRQNNSLPTMAFAPPLDPQELDSLAAQPAAKLAAPSAEPLSFEFKLKIFSTLEQTKQVSLAGVRLRYYLSANNASVLASALRNPASLQDVYYVDLLQHFPVKIVSGVEAVKLSPDLLQATKALQGVSTSSSNVQWKMPLPAYSSLEIVFERTDTVSAAVTALLESNSRWSHHRFCTGNIKLLIWNAPSEQASGLWSGARDIEVYSNRKVAFNGELPAGTRGLAPLARCNDFINLASQKEPEPSLVLNVVDSSEVNSTLNEVQAKSVTMGAAVLTTTSSPPSGRAVERRSASMAGNPKPEWLVGISQQQQATTGVMATPLRTPANIDPLSGLEILETPVRSSSSRRSSRHAAAEAESSTPAAASAERVGKNDSPKRILNGRRRGNRSTSKLLGNEDDAPSTENITRLDAPAEGAPDSSRSFAATSGQRDGLRRSLEAVSYAEHNNFNRLTSAISLRTLPASSDGAATSSTLDREELPENDDSKEVVSSNASTVNLQAHRQRRADRIQHVNSKVNLVLNDLADILSTLPSKFPPPKLQSQSLPAPAHALHTDDVLPTGTRLRMDVYSTWGDGSYLGLNGLEVYDQILRLVPFQGKQPCITQISAYPRDLTELPGYSDDPRLVRNLLDGVNTTKDDLHQWLAPQLHLLHSLVKSATPASPDFFREITDTEGLLGSLHLVFSHPISIAALRIYNFNKSRTHNQRGIRKCRIFLDRQMIFEGEVKKASGQHKNDVQDAHVVAFTADLSALQQQLMHSAGSGGHESGAKGAEIPTDDLEESRASLLDRPPTAVKEDGDRANEQRAVERDSGLGDEGLDMVEMEGSSGAEDADSMLRASMSSNGLLLGLPRATTPVAMPSLPEEEVIAPILPQDPAVDDSANSLDSFMHELHSLNMKYEHDPSTQTVSRIKAAAPAKPAAAIPASAAAPGTASGQVTSPGIACRNVKLILLDTHGDRDYVGLTGIQLLSPSLTPLSCSVSTDPNKDISLVHPTHVCKPDNLLCKPNCTDDDSNMWMGPYYSSRGGASAGEATDLPTLLRDYQFISLSLAGSGGSLAGLRVWNYNVPGEGALRGVKQMLIFLDDRPFFRVVLRQAPGHAMLPFDQVLLFDQLYLQGSLVSGAVRPGPRSYLTPKMRQTYEHVACCQGLVFTLHLLSTHGDVYYVGLDHLDMYLAGHPQPLTINTLLSLGGNVTAYPHSVNVLSSTTERKKDPRIPEQLFVRAAAGMAATGLKSCWLTPLAQTLTAEERRLHYAMASSLQLSQHAPRLESTSAAKFTDKSGAPKNTYLTISFPYPVSLAALRYVCACVRFLPFSV